MSLLAETRLRIGRPYSTQSSFSFKTKGFYPKNNGIPQFPRDGNLVLGSQTTLHIRKGERAEAENYARYILNQEVPSSVSQIDVSLPKSNVAAADRYFGGGGEIAGGGLDEDETPGTPSAPFISDTPIQTNRNSMDQSQNTVAMESQGRQSYDTQTPRPSLLGENETFYTPRLENTIHTNKVFRTPGLLQNATFQPSTPVVSEKSVGKTPLRFEGQTSMSSPDIFFRGELIRTPVRRVESKEVDGGITQVSLPRDNMKVDDENSMYVNNVPQIELSASISGSQDSIYSFTNQALNAINNTMEQYGDSPTTSRGSKKLERSESEQLTRTPVKKGASKSSESPKPKRKQPSRKGRYKGSYQE